MKSLSNTEISYYTNLALAYKANHQFQESIDIIDQMTSNANFKGQQMSELYRKGLLTKARSIMMDAK